MIIQQTDLSQHRLLREVVDILRGQRIEAYLVGGAVRDLLLHRENLVDLDFAVPGNGLTLARRVANRLGAAFYPLDAERGVGRIVVAPAGEAKSHLDFATFRGPSLLADLADRDFTINAMALRLGDPLELIDPLNGYQDLEAGSIRAASTEAFQNDPARVLRAVRQAVGFGFTIEAATERQLRRAAAALPAVSAERQRDEFLKLLHTPTPGQAVRELDRLEVLPHLLPEVEPMREVKQSAPHHLDVFQHTLAAMDAWAVMQESSFPELPARFQTGVREYMAHPLTGDLNLADLMPLALLLHDTGKAFTRTEEGGRARFLGHEQESARITRSVIRRFRFSSQAGGFVETVVANHMRPLLLAAAGGATRRAIYRLFRDTSQPGYQAGLAVGLHALADQQATYPPGQGQADRQLLLRLVEQLATAFFEQHDQVVDPPPLLTGRDLMEQLGLREGPLIGRLLSHLKEAQATGQVQDKAEALVFVQNDPELAQPLDE